MTRNMLNRCYLLLALLAVHAPAWAALERVDDFALLDQRGEFHQLSRYRHVRALAVMAYSAECPSMAGMAAQFTRFAGGFDDRGVSFVFLDIEGLGRERLRGLELEMPILDDAGQIVSAALEFGQAGEVALLNPERLSLFYRGASDAGFEQALDDLLTDGIADSIRAPLESGCPLEFPVREAMLAEPPDYVSEVAPRIIENCGMCHRRGGVGPFALDSYLMLLGWSPMIREVLLNKRMPPMQVDPHIGNSGDARHICVEDLQVLINWIEPRARHDNRGGRPAAGAAEPARARMRLGEPDYIVQAPGRTFRHGSAHNTYEVAELGFNERNGCGRCNTCRATSSVLHH